MSNRFKRTRRGIRVSLSAAEIELLRNLPTELRGVLEGPADPDDPVRTRLFPRAYLDPTDEVAEAEWQELVHPELVRERLAALDLLITSLDRGATRKDRVEVDLTDDEVNAWLGVLNDARLALGVRLGVTEDLAYEELDEHDPDAPAYAVYGWLTWIEGDLVETLLGGR